MFIGTLQVALIVIVAVFLFDVSVKGQISKIMFAALSAASLSSALALLISCLCTSSAQMNTISTFVVLLCSAIGGSMVPRFMMPDWLQNIAQFTPNYWAIEGFYGILARRQNLFDLLDVWQVLWSVSFIALILTIFISHRMRRL